MEGSAVSVVYLDISDSLRVGFVKTGNFDEFGYSLLQHSGTPSHCTVRVPQQFEWLLKWFPQSTSQTAGEADIQNWCSSLPAVTRQCQKLGINMKGIDLSAVLTGLNEIGWENVLNLGDSLSQVTLCVKASHRRKIPFTLTFDNEFPKSKPKFSSPSLPPGFDIEWNQSKSLQNVYSCVRKYAESMQEFWTEMEELDRQVWVLHPENPSLADTKRRIAINPNLCIELSIDPKQPRSLPEIKLMGSEADISELTENLNNNLDTWDSSLSILGNLERILGIQFPVPSLSQREDVAVNCLICLEYEEEDGSIPDQLCQTCRTSYHHSCLYKAFLTKRKGRSGQTCFGYRLGQCPHCKTEMKIKIST